MPPGATPVCYTLCMEDDREALTGAGLREFGRSPMATGAAPLTASGTLGQMH